MAAETMETKQDLVRLMEVAIAKAKGRRMRRVSDHPVTKKRVRHRATGRQ